MADHPRGWSAALMNYICIPGCSYQDLEIILRREPFEEWLGPQRRLVKNIVDHMITGRHQEEDVVRYCQHISSAIYTHAQNKKWKSTGILMNCTWSEEYFKVSIPTGPEEQFGNIRIQKGGIAVNVFLNFQNALQFMSTLAFTSLGDRTVEFGTLRATLKQTTFLIWCEEMKPGLSAPFRDMIEDNEL